MRSCYYYLSQHPLVVVAVVIRASSYICTCIHTHTHMCVCVRACVYIYSNIAHSCPPSSLYLSLYLYREREIEGCFVWGKLCWHQWWASYGLRTALSLLLLFALLY